MLFTHGPTVQVASLLSQLACLMLWEARGSLWERVITSYRVHTRRRSRVEYRPFDPSEGSPKVDFTMVLVLRSEELARPAYMGVQPIHG